MKKILPIFLLVLIIIYPIKTYAITSSGKGTIVMDIDSGRILYEHDSNSERLIASTTKIMTFLVALTYARDKLDSKVTVGEEVLKMYGTNMYLSIDEELTLRDLLYGLMLRSGNDASVVIATYVAGSIDNFVYLMNEEANKIGMLNTIYKNPHGLDEETKNYSTPYDLAILTRYLYLNFPEYKEIAGSKYYDFKSNQKSYSLTNRCKILFDYKNITSVKSGYTPSAGRALVSTATNGKLNLLIVTLDDDEMYENHQNLYEYFFKNYDNYLLLDKDKFRLDKSLFTNYYIKNSFTYPLRKDEVGIIKTKIIVNDKKSNILGSIKFYLNNKEIHEENIYEYKNEIKENNNLFTKIGKFFKNIFN